MSPGSSQSVSWARMRTLLNRIRQVVADVTHCSLDQINENTSRQNLGAWDSVAHINVIVGIEAEFGVSFSVEEMYSIDSVEKIRNAIEQAHGDVAERK